MWTVSGCSPEGMSEALQDNEPSILTAGGHKEVSGGNFIAGVFIQAVNKKMSIYDAMMRGVLTPGTALVLLEAQAASGLLTDPVSNQRLCVKEALAAGLIGRDFYEKLLSAEGAVRGYTEPFSGRSISLFQAMEQELIVREHAIRLLEAQIATGGIIDPAHGLRLPVQVACQRGYFDQEVCQVLSDPQHQTRSCFDPNTHENLTYLQLLRRCVPDPDTGLLMLQLMDKGSVLYQLSQEARKALQATHTTLSLGLFQGQSVSLWELLFSRYVPEHQREELLRKYKAGVVTVPEMISILTAIVTEAETETRAGSSPTLTPSKEEGASPPVQDVHSQEQQLRKSLKSATVRVTAGEFQGQTISLLDLLFSRHVPQGKRQALLELYRAGILSTEQVATVVTTMVNRGGAVGATLTASARSPHKVETEANPAPDAQLDDILKSATVEMPAGEFQGREVSVWDLLFSDYIPEEKRQELLQLYRERLLTVQQMMVVVTTLVKKKESTSRKFLVSVKSSSKDTLSAGGEEDGGSSREEPWQAALRTTVMDMEVGEFQGRKVSVWELLHSEYIPEENRKELLELFQAGELTLEQVETVVRTIVTKAEAARAEQVAHASGPRAEPKVTESEENRTWEETLKSTRVEMSVGEFQGKQVSVWDLLFSDYIPEEKRQELLQLYCQGTLPIQDLLSTSSSIVAESRRHLATLPQQTVDLLRSEGSYITLGPFQEQKVSVWELLSTRQVSEFKREAQLDSYGAGGLTVNRITVTTTVITGPWRQHL